MAGFYTAALSKSPALQWPGLSPPSTGIAFSRRMTRLFFTKLGRRTALTGCDGLTQPWKTGQLCRRQSNHFCAARDQHFGDCWSMSFLPSLRLNGRLNQCDATFLADWVNCSRRALVGWRGTERFYSEGLSSANNQRRASTASLKMRTLARGRTRLA
jgi:hypothetical protein